MSALAANETSQGETKIGTRTSSLVLARRVWYSHVEFGTRVAVLFFKIFFHQVLGNFYAIMSFLAPNTRYFTYFTT